MVVVNSATTASEVSIAFVDKAIESRTTIQSLVKTLMNAWNRNHAIHRMESVKTSWEVSNAPAKKDTNFSLIKSHVSVCNLKDLFYIIYAGNFRFSIFLVSTTTVFGLQRALRECYAREHWSRHLFRGP